MPARIRGCALFFSNQIHDIAELLSDIIIIAAFVRHQTGRAVFDSIFQNLKIAAAVLAVNNYRDEEHDASVGRCTLAVLLGQKGMLRAFGFSVLMPYALTALLVLLNPSLWPVFISWSTIPLAWRSVRDLSLKKGLELNGVMFAVIRLELLFSLLLTAGAVAAFVLTLV